MKPEFQRTAAHAWLGRTTRARRGGEITEKAATRYPYLAKCGGTYSSDGTGRRSCTAGGPRRRSLRPPTRGRVGRLCAAFITGHYDPLTLPAGVRGRPQGDVQRPLGGLPSQEFLAELDPALADLRDRYAPAQLQPTGGGTADETWRRSRSAGGVPVAVGAFDAHMARSARDQPGTLVKIIGTTLRHDGRPLAAELPDVPGLCGISPLDHPRMYGLERPVGRGDIFNWFAKYLPVQYTAKATCIRILRATRTTAAGESGLLALDWNNGNRTILVDPLLVACWSATCTPCGGNLPRVGRGHGLRH